MLRELERSGAKVFAGHRAGQLGDPDVVVISTAIPAKNPELDAARRRGIPVLARIQMLAALGHGKTTYGVSGTHGKTTTTSMLAVILEAAGCDPTYVIGGDLNEIGSGARYGRGTPFVVEADESDGSFLLLSPNVAVVTNVEEDHLDFYRGGSAEIRAAFAEFFLRSERAVACGDDEGVRAALELADRQAMTYGLAPDNDAVLSVLESQPGQAKGSLRMGAADIELLVNAPGVHNLLNACAALLAAGMAGVEPTVAAEALTGFEGVRRRFEYLGRARGAEFFDDYAHHPSEISATLAAARGMAPERLVAVFQPHRYSRTEVQWRGMGQAMAAADVAVITDVYPAGEAPIPGVSGKLLVDALSESDPRKRLVYLPRRTDVAGFLASEVRAGDMVLTLGAGDITSVAAETLELIRELG
jgi:UDP-N-acetylmuramate--alanine ligase